MRLVMLMVMLVIFIIGVTFAMLNAKMVHVNYYFGEKDLSLSILLMVTFILGIMVGWMTTIIKLLCYKVRLYRLQYHLEQAKKEIISIKAFGDKSKHHKS